MVLDASSTDPVPDDCILPIPFSISPLHSFLRTFLNKSDLGSTVGSDGLIAINDRDRSSIHESSPSSDDRPIANQWSRCVDEEALRF